MDKNKFMIHVSKKENGKQARHFLQEVSGYIDNDLQVGFTFDEHKHFKATDILTGRAIVSGYGMNLQYHIDIFMQNCIDTVKEMRLAYWYNDAVKVFEILKKNGEPMTERKINSILYK